MDNIIQPEIEAAKVVARALDAASFVAGAQYEEPNIYVSDPLVQGDYAVFSVLHDDFTFYAYVTTPDIDRGSDDGVFLYEDFGARSRAFELVHLAASGLTQFEPDDEYKGYLTCGEQIVVDSSFVARLALRTRDGRDLELSIAFTE